MRYIELAMNFQIFRLQSLKTLLKLFFHLLPNKNNLKLSLRNFVKSWEIPVHKLRKSSGVTVLKF